MASYSKHLLSNSVNGLQIQITGINTGSANTIHTSISGTSGSDAVWIYAYNNDIIPQSVYLLWGNTSSSFTSQILPKSGRTLIVDGMLLQNGLSIKAYALSPNVIMLDGFVNEISP